MLEHWSGVLAMMNGNAWMRHFISHILYITHLQCIFWNVTHRDSIHGTLQLWKYTEVLREVETLLETDPLQVHAESKLLLDLYFDSPYHSSFEWQRAGRRTALLWFCRGAGALHKAGRVWVSHPTLDASAVAEHMRVELTLQSLPSYQQIVPTSRDGVAGPFNKRLRKPDRGSKHLGQHPWALPAVLSLRCWWLQS